MQPCGFAQLEVASPALLLNCAFRPQWEKEQSGAAAHFLGVDSSFDN
jgi:hypothetical protein